MTALDSSPSPLLQAENLRIDLEGVIALERTSFRTEGSSLALAGEVTALMSALAGIAKPMAGSLRLFGRDVGKGEHLEIVGLAPLDPPLPPKWTALDYVAWSARLAGIPKSSSKRLSRDALASLDASSLSEVELGRLGVAERRVVLLAHAIVAAPKVVIASMPLANLEGAAAEYVLRAFERATQERAFIASVSRLDPASPEHAIAARANDLLVFGSGRLLRSGKLDVSSPRASTYELWVRGHAEALKGNLAARGIELHGGPDRFWVRLPEGVDTDTLFAASIETEAPIVQLLPRKEW